MSKRPHSPAPLDDEPAAKVQALDAEILALEPASENNLLVWQEDIRAGVRCTRTDIMRLTSPFLDVLIECATREGEQRITLPNDTFKTAATMFAVFRLTCLSGFATEIDTETLLEVCHAAHKLDLVHRPSMARLFVHLADEACFPAEQMIELGKRYRLHALVRRGALALAAEYRCGMP
ncbi:MAG: hypothetical protein Q7V62_00110 [Actinomycetota bacterium]|nr:hypothetical protein [Actinomycetota bacterium]